MSYICLSNPQQLQDFFLNEDNTAIDMFLPTFYLKEKVIIA